MNTDTLSQPISPELVAVLARLEKCAAFDGYSLLELLQDVARDLETQIADETPQ